MGVMRLIEAIVLIEFFYFLLNLLPFYRLFSYQEYASEFRVLRCQWVFRIPLRIHPISWIVATEHIHVDIL